MYIRPVWYIHLWIDLNDANYFPKLTHCNPKFCSGTNSYNAESRDLNLNHIECNNNIKKAADDDDDKGAANDDKKTDDDDTVTLTDDDDKQADDDDDKGNDDDDDGKLSTGAKVGIAGGVVGGVAALIGAGLLASNIRMLHHCCPTKTLGKSSAGDPPSQMDWISKYLVDLCNQNL